MLILCFFIFSKDKCSDVVNLGFSFISYKLPMMEILLDFYDNLKSCSEGYATFNYTEEVYINSEVGKLDILLCTKNANIITHHFKLCIIFYQY